MVTSSRTPTTDALPTRPLEGRWFHDPGVFEEEQRAVFEGVWLCAGPAGDLAETGDWTTRRLGDDPLLFSRSEHGIHGFYNVCRHRGTQLVDGSCGRGARNFQCPYHAWTYALDGSMLGAPRMKGVPGFDPSELGLVPLDTAVWSGLLWFRRGSTGPASPAEQFRDLPDLSPWCGGELAVAERRRYRVAANWKVLCHNYGECYHCALVHPQLDDISSYLSGGEQFSGASFVGGPMRLEDGCNTMNTTGRTDRRPFPGVSGDDLRLVTFWNLYPNTLLSLHPDYVVSYVLWPVAPDETVIDCDFLFPAHLVAAGDLDVSSEVEFWDLTNRQDWAICERTQVGVSSRGYRPGMYHEGESCLVEFDRWYRGRMGAARRTP